MSGATPPGGRLEADAPEQVADGVWRIPVESPTLPPFDRTNAYLLLRDRIGVVVDPGGAGERAIADIAATAAHCAVRPKGVVLTHTHPDHVAGVDGLRARWPDLTVWVHPLELHRTDPAWNAVGLADGRHLTLADTLVRAVHTPGHSPGHLALWLEDERVLVAGDLVAGAGSIWVGLPDGDLRAYGESLASAAALDPATVAPGHGPVRRDGAAVLDEARAHRRQREAQVLAALRPAPRDLLELRTLVYGPLDGVVADLAERSLLAQLRELMRQGRVMHVGSDASGPYVAAPGA